MKNIYFEISNYSILTEAEEFFFKISFDFQINTKLGIFKFHAYL